MKWCQTPGPGATHRTSDVALQLNDSVGFFVVLFSLALISCPEQYVSRFWRTRNDDSFPLFPLLHCFI